MEIERKLFGCGQFKATEATEGIAEMIVSVFNNVDAGSDIVMPGFFAASIANRRTSDGRPKAKGVWSHDWTSPVAKTLDARELQPGDPLLPAQLSGLGGLWVKAQFNLDTQRGREAFSDLQFGSIDEFSIGYSTKRAEYDHESGIRKLYEGEWYEWSPVLVGMNDATALLNTKQSEGQTLEAQGTTALAAVVAYTERLRSVADLRAKEGRAISTARRDQMSGIADQLETAAANLRAILKETEPQKEPEKGVDATALFVEYQRTLARLSGAARS